MEANTKVADFGGYATKAGLKCSDGRTITPDAFAHQDKLKVPLVWQHAHEAPMNVLGHAILEARSDGIYCHGYFNSTEPGQTAKALIQHGDITMLSIYANKLIERAKSVLHGAIREVSLVLSGANPGALIDAVSIAHSDGDVELLEDEAIIYTGLTLEHTSSDELVVEHAGDETSDDTLREIYETLNEQQKTVVHYMIGAALEDAADSSDDTAKHSDDDSEITKDNSENDSKDVDGTESGMDDVTSTESADENSVDKSGDTNEEGNLNHQEGITDMTRNVFEQNDADTKNSATLTHDQLSTIVENAKKPGGSFKEAVLMHAQEYGITDINVLFPDAKAVTNTPEWISRRMEWVSVVLGGTRHSPFAKVKTLTADITADEARAKGYVKGARKVEEVFGLLQRTTGPSTIYKKQKLDRDDILDITDIDVVDWLKAEMRLMIEEEIARAILVGDGRSSMSPDKVKDPMGAVDGTGIRSILHDDALYSIKVELASNVSPKDAVKGLVRASVAYKGSGSPTMFISRTDLVDMLLEEDKFGRPLYADRGALADKLGVSKIETVDLFDEYDGLYAIMVSLSDYTIGSNKGGELTSFEDFDIDFNQYKYLQETRLSGGLTKPFSAVVISRAVGTLAVAAQPSFDGATDTITIPDVTGVIYTINGTAVTGTVVITVSTEVNAEAAAGYYLASNTTRSWTYTP